MQPVRYVFLLFFPVTIVWISSAPVWGQDLSPVKRGEQVFRAAGGCGCHTDYANKGAFMAGGRAIKTPFGKIYSTNITPDRKTGIGSWTDEQFVNALANGIGPNGQHYFPIFPYTSFTKMTRRDLLGLKAYLLSIPAVGHENRPPDIKPPFSWRSGLVLWKWLYFEPGTFQQDPTQSPQWNRGAYLVTGPGHCGECHTPRTILGGLKESMYYAGSVEGPEGELSPNITPDRETGIGDWSIEDIVWFLQTGIKPDGDDVQGLMSEVIEYGFKDIPEDDLRAIAVYLLSLKPIRNKVEPKNSPPG